MSVLQDKMSIEELWRYAVENPESVVKFWISSDKYDDEDSYGNLIVKDLETNRIFSCSYYTFVDTQSNNPQDYKPVYTDRLGTPVQEVAYRTLRNDRLDYQHSEYLPINQTSDKAKIYDPSVGDYVDVDLKVIKENTMNEEIERQIQEVLENAGVMNNSGQLEELKTKLLSLLQVDVEVYNSEKIGNYIAFDWRNEYELYLIEEDLTVLLDQPNGSTPIGKFKSVDAIVQYFQFMKSNTEFNF